MCVWGGPREGTDGCVREDFFSAFPPPWQPVVLAKVLGGGWRRGTGLENIRRVANVPDLIADQDLGLALNITGRSKPPQEAASMPQGYLLSPLEDSSNVPTYKKIFHIKTKLGSPTSGLF